MLVVEREGEQKSARRVERGWSGDINKTSPMVFIIFLTWKVKGKVFLLHRQND